MGATGNVGRELVAILAARGHGVRDIAFRAQPDGEARAEMEAAMPTAYADAFFEFFTEGGADETTVRSTVGDVTGAPPRSFRDWATANAAAFR